MTRPTTGGEADEARRPDERSESRHEAERRSSNDRLTWLGHATAVVELGGARLLVDPLFRRRARRAGAVDAVLITHSHVDHLNRWTLKAIDRAAHLVVPKGARPIVDDLGFSRVTELEPGDAVEIAGCEVAAVPTAHDAGRWRKSSSPLCNGYVVRRGDLAVHHAGDVDFSDHTIFDAIGKRFTLAATMLPIGGMLPVWYYRMRRRAFDRGVHIDPDCALDVYERLGAASMIPVHWGTVNLRFGSSKTPKKRLVQIADVRGIARRVRVLDHGESQVVAQHPDDADHPDRESGERTEHAIADGGAP
jgi:L-ascorbate metabolism protein UlaG (beta-lactamase superfamily)